MMDLVTRPEADMGVSLRFQRRESGAPGKSRLIGKRSEDDSSKRNRLARVSTSPNSSMPSTHIHT